jgi:hypothetical protein
MLMIRVQFFLLPSTEVVDTVTMSRRNPHVLAFGSPVILTSCPDYVSAVIGIFIIFVALLWVFKRMSY